MRLSAHIKPVDVAGVVTQTGRIAQLLGLLMALPAAVAVVFAELAEAGAFAAVAVVLFGSGWLAARRRRENIGFNEGLVITALSYLLASLAGALVLFPEVGFVDAFFEAMSGFTTTGLTVVPLDGLPRSLIFFRAYSQWIGGAGIVVLTLVVLLRTNRPAHRLYVSEADERQLLGSVRSTSAAVATVYLVLTAATVAALAAAGMGLFDAVLHALATVSTGGFSPHRESLAGFASPAIRAVVVVGMLAGAVSFPLLARLREDGPRSFGRDPQLRALLAGSLVAGGLMWLAAGGGDPLAALFRAVTALTTTGFSVSDPAGWTAPSRSVAVVLMVVGGSAGSTAGGIKLIRSILLLRLGWWLIARTLLPAEARIPVRHGRVTTSEGELLTVTAFVVIYVVLLALSAVALTFTGASLGDGLFEAASALGTVGLSVGVTSPDLPIWAKLVLTLDMWLGRLEIVPVLALLVPGIWRED